MVWSLFARLSGGAWRRMARPFGAALLVALTLVVSACGAGTSGNGGAPSPTPKPSATRTPPPCASWRIVSSPNLTHLRDNELLAVSALSPTAAWAVGGALTDGLAEQSLIERWDGSAWKIVPNPNTLSFFTVVALSPTDAWVIGYNRTPRQVGRITLIERWNGQQWSEVPNPNPHEPNYFTLGMAANGANEVWAVGQAFTPANISLPLTERWDGSAWKIVANPALPGVTEGLLYAVAHVPGSDQFWAVGYALTGPRPAYEQPLIERWDGSAWQVVASPTLPSGALGGRLHGVTARAANDIWAVGDYTASDHTLRALTVHWDGVAWKVVTSPNTWGTLSSVAVASANDVRAVGYALASDGNTRHALIEQWNGASWQIATRPEPTGATYSNLTGIATDGSGGYWAVGSYLNAAGVEQTLTARCP